MSFQQFMRENWMMMVGLSIAVVGGQVAAWTADTRLLTVAWAWLSGWAFWALMVGTFGKRR